jgi:hypothetical protein
MATIDCSALISKNLLHTIGELGAEGCDKITEKIISTGVRSFSVNFTVCHPTELCISWQNNNTFDSIVFKYPGVEAVKKILEFWGIGNLVDVGNHVEIYTDENCAVRWRGTGYCLVTGSD